MTHIKQIATIVLQIVSVFATGIACSSLSENRGYAANDSASATEYSPYIAGLIIPLISQTPKNCIALAITFDESSDSNTLVLFCFNYCPLCAFAQTVTDLAAFTAALARPPQHLQPVRRNRAAGGLLQQALVGLQHQKLLEGDFMASYSSILRMRKRPVMAIFWAMPAGVRM